MPEWLDEQWVGSVAAVAVGLVLAEAIRAVRWWLGRGGRRRAAETEARNRRSAEFRYYVELQLLATNMTLSMRRRGVIADPTGIVWQVANSGAVFRAPLLANDADLRQLVDAHRRAGANIEGAAASGTLDALTQEILALEWKINERMVALGIVG